MAEHSPLPWTIAVEKGHVFAGNRLVAGCMGHQDNFTDNVNEINQANAALIVRCVNSHDALVAALHEAVDALRIFHGLGMSPATAATAWTLYQQSPEMKRIHAALAQAEADQ